MSEASTPRDYSEDVARYLEQLHTDLELDTAEFVSADGWAEVNRFGGGVATIESYQETFDFIAGNGDSVTIEVGGDEQTVVETREDACEFVESLAEEVRMGPNEVFLTDQSLRHPNDDVSAVTRAYAFLYDSAEVTLTIRTDDCVPTYE